MRTRLHDQVEAALPDEGRVWRAMTVTPEEVWAEAAQALLPILSAFDLVITAHGEGEAFGSALAGLQGVTLVVAQRELLDRPHFCAREWMIAQQPLIGKRQALIATPCLQEARTELELALLARQGGLDVTAVASALEFTDVVGRSRLCMQGVDVCSLLRLARTPGGVKFEQRGAGGQQLLPLR